MCPCQMERSTPPAAQMNNSTPKVILLMEDGIEGEEHKTDKSENIKQKKTAFTTSRKEILTMMPLLFLN